MPHGLAGRDCTNYGDWYFVAYAPWAHYFKLQALPLAYFPCLIAILLGYITLT
ncbi:hypothetical protein WAE56_00005 [Iodobacter sp. LRB]|uniref:hypothetical protein n=1 Tax=unclassified Iodobacter TaxID=235634 RepID=UPI001C55907F|nr:hypothetical protein [Iodobacter sp. BJB302]